jgi:predicted HTH transcriptional regulator
MKNLENLIQELTQLPCETEWLEFKQNNAVPEEIGQYISALSNAAACHEHDNAYLIWGVDDKTHEIVGTAFEPRTCKKGNEELESWLRRHLTENANFHFDSIILNTKKVVVLIISKAVFTTVKFKDTAYIRVGTYKKPLKDFPAIEVALWNKINSVKVEQIFAEQDLSMSEVL